MTLMLSLLTLGTNASGDVGPWAADLAAQQPSERLRLECRYTSADRKQAEILGETYEIILHMGDDEKSRAILRTPHADGFADAGSLSLAIEADGQTFSSLRATEDSRINLYRRGPYYIEVHWFDVQCVSQSGTAFPARGEVVFYCYGEQVLVQAVWHATEDVGAGTARIAWQRTDTAPSSLFPHGYAEPAVFQALKERETVSSGMTVFSGCPGAYAAGEVEPLPDDAIEVLDGVEAQYDPARGCYRIGTNNPGGFSYHYYQNPNHYETARFTIRNDNHPRKVYICHETLRAPGSVECGVVLDGDGDPLPIMVQISKNFAGEKEERFYNPEDTPFSETIFPLYLAPNETREVTSLHLYQNWGNHPLKQFSSLGAWMDYYHSSTGVTETTCFVPFKFGGLPGVAIADLRPMSQRMWESQPQHDNVAGHRFLMVKAEGTWHYARYLGTTFRSTGPNWMDISIDYLLDDGRIRARLDSFELPQTDELRNFIRLRCDVLAPVSIETLGTDFRLLDITSRIQRLRYKQAAWQAAPDRVAVRDLEEQDAMPVAGEPLAGDCPWATVYGEAKGCNSYVVRRFEARLGGRTCGPAVSVQTHKSGDMNLALTALGGRAELKPGDYVEAEFAIMPYGNDRNTYETPQTDRVPFGADAPRVTEVARGKRLSDFPCRVRAGKKGLAEFTVAGGTNFIPVIVEGLRSYQHPRLEARQEDAVWAPVPHSTVGNDGYQVFVDDRGTFGCVFLVEGGPEPRTYRVVHGAPPQVTVRPRLRADDAPMANLVEVQAPWMNQPINLRFPETIITDFGIHFIDHLREDMPGKTDISTLADWHRGPGGSFWYDWDLSDQCKAGGIVSPGVDEVTFEYWFYNGNERGTWVDTQFCLRLWDDLLRDDTGERTYVVSDGEWVRMADTDRGKGRRELCQYPAIGGWDLPDNDDPTSWGKGRITADRGLVAVVAPDGNHLIGLAFDHPKSILSNWLIPCIHADPVWPTCGPGEHVRVRGKLYLIEGDLNDLLMRYTQDSKKGDRSN